LILIKTGSDNDFKEQLFHTAELEYLMKKYSNAGKYDCLFWACYGSVGKVGERLMGL